ARSSALRVFLKYSTPHTVLRSNDAANFSVAAFRDWESVRGVSQNVVLTEHGRLSEVLARGLLGASPKPTTKSKSLRSMCLNSSADHFDTISALPTNTALSL